MPNLFKESNYMLSNLYNHVDNFWAQNRLHKKKQSMKM